MNARGIPYMAVIVTMIGAMPGLLSEQFAPEAIFKNLLGCGSIYHGRRLDEYLLKPI